MTISKIVKQKQVSRSCTYKMFEIHYTISKKVLYKIVKICECDGDTSKHVLVQPVSKEIAESVWQELVEWKESYNEK